MLISYYIFLSSSWGDKLWFLEGGLVHIMTSVALLRAMLIRSIPCLLVSTYKLTGFQFFPVEYKQGSEQKSTTMGYTK